MQCTPAFARRLAALAILLATLPEVAGAQYFGRNKVQYDDFDFQSFETAHYRIYFYPEEELATRDAGRMAERWYTRHARTFDHTPERKPLIFYANDADFQQTNVIEGAISQGVGGVTEGLQQRVVMPLTGIYRETDHVLGHELVHSFQYDIATSPGGGGIRGMSRVPLWLVEGMAEYLSLGRDDPHTAMWIRDAVLRDELPSIEDLDDPRFFPYRYGQAYAAFIGGTWGDEAVTRIFRLGLTTPLDSAFQVVTGLDSEALSERWKEQARAYYQPLLEGRTLPAEAGRRVLAEDVDAGELNIAPAVSPDGRYVAFLSERDVFSIDLFLANAQTGEVIDRLASSDTDPHFDALRFINSAGTWSPDGNRFAYVVFARGENRINILDVDRMDLVGRIRTPDVGAIANPAWSPDGRYLAFSGIEGGISDLFLYDFQTEAIVRLTDDRFADLQPEWAPDGQTIAWVTDRGPGGTDFEDLSYAPVRLGLMDVESREIQVIAPFEGAKHINPQFSPDGRSLFFISDRAGVSNIYRTELSSGRLFQITDVATGVTGITELAPALSVADQSGLVMFSVFSDGGYGVFSKTLDEAEGTPVEAAPTGPALAGLLPPALAVEDLGIVGNYLRDPRTGLPELAQVDARDYAPKLRLSYVGPPSVGVGYDTQFGAGLAGGVSFFWSDILGNHLLGTSIQAQGSLQDIGGEVFYLNRDDQFNYGVQISHTPYLTGSSTIQRVEDSNLRELTQFMRRIFFTGGQTFAHYPLSTTRRLEGQAGAHRLWYDLEATRLLVDPQGRVVGREKEGLPAPDPIMMYATSAAYVIDNAAFGFVSPVRGMRARLEAGYTAGGFNYGTLLADYRRYLRLQPFTFALGAYHYGRYGTDAQLENQRFYPLNLGYSMYNVRGVRGYSIGSFDLTECADTTGENCPVLDRVIGTRVAVAAAELRFPLTGVERFGLINFPYLPIELVLFGDAGLAWTGDRTPSLVFERDSQRDDIPVFSTGAAARVGLFGYAVLEAYFVYPFQRPDKGWFPGFTLTPGW